MASSGRASLLMLHAIAAAAKERTAAAQKKMQERRDDANKKREEAPKPEVPSFDLSLTNDGQKARRPVNSTQVKEWLRAGLRTLYGEKLTLPRDNEWWTVHEKSLALKLLRSYGPDLVEKTLAHFCATWPQRVDEAEGRLGGIPTIGLLWKLREGIFAEAQGVVKQTKRTGRKRKDKNSDEYQRPDKPIGIGWT